MTGKARRFFDPRFLWTERRRQNRLAFILFWSILMYYLVKGNVISLGMVADDSMHPAVRRGAYYLTNRYIYNFTHPERGDLVVFRRAKYATNEEVKRVIGLPGETVLIKSGQVYINGRRLDEPYAVGATYPDFGPYIVEKDSYFVLGDNRWVREDSRDYGAVPLEIIKGKIKPGVFFPFR
jgi:signal peptidase I